jgi:CheY-like chemotaxis protein
MTPSPSDIGVALPAGTRVLLVEDEATVAILLEDILATYGCTVVKAARVGKACELAGTADVDVAFLDVNVAGEAVYPVAQELDRRSIPFVFTTGYSTGGVRADYRARPSLAKPFSIASVRQALAAMLATRSRG